MEIALKLLVEEEDLIKIDCTESDQKKRNSIKMIGNSVKMNSQSFSLDMSGNILDELANNNFKKARASFAITNRRGGSMTQSMLLRPHNSVRVSSFN